MTVTVYPPMPVTKCDRAPVTPQVFDNDADFALWLKAVSDAGDDCRLKLDAVDGVVSKWPSAK